MNLMKFLVILDLGIDGSNSVILDVMVAWLMEQDRKWSQQETKKKIELKYNGRYREMKKK